MPKAQPPLTVVHIGGTDPAYPSATALLEANAALFVELIRDGARILGLDPLTGERLPDAENAPAITGAV